MFRTLGRSVTLAGLVALAVVSPALARHRPQACKGGTFFADGTALVTGDAAPAMAQVVIGATTIAIPGVCADAVPVRLVPGRKGTAITAKWSSCAALGGQVTLKARLAAPACD